MAIEQTFSIIKPNAMNKNAIGSIIAKFEENGLKIAAAKLVKLTQQQCEEFYAEHKERPFFGELVTFMTKNREIMGATNPAEAADGTIRKLFGDSVGENAVHGSDSPESAQRELGLFFESNEICNK